MNELLDRAPAGSPRLYTGTAPARVTWRAGAAVPRPEESRTLGPQPLSERRPFTGKTVLLVEDDPDVRQMMTALLEVEHYAVTPAADGQEALRCLREQLPDLILLDLVTPRMSGWDLLELLQLDPAWAQIPVVILSGVAAGALKATELPAAAVLMKPVRLSTLRRTLARLRSPSRSPDLPVGSAGEPVGSDAPEVQTLA